MNAFRLFVASVAMIAPLAIIGCKSGGSSSTQPATQDAPAYPPAPASSPLSKIKVDMSTNEVISLIGNPTNIDAHMTGKQFIPFYYGGDTHRVQYRYKDQGRVIFAPNSRFSSGESVVEIQYDPTETGYTCAADKQ